MKIVMPIAGKGTRLRPHTYAIPKSLIRVGGKAIIDYIFEQLYNIKYSEMIFIIGHLGDQIRDYITKEKTGVFSFVRQTEYKGLGHAIYMSKKFFQNDEDLLIVLGDIIFTADLNYIIKASDNMIGVMEVNDPRKFGVVTIDNKGYITNMIEKPKDPPSNLAIVGIYYFKSAFKLFEAIETLFRENITTKNEYQLTDAMRIMLNNGEKFKVFTVPEIYDCGEKESLLETNKIMLEKNLNNYKIDGNIIVPPVFIGKDTIIKNSVIGPNVSISEDSYVCNSIIKNCVIGKNVEIMDILLDKSILGDNCSIKGSYKELNIGPDSELFLSN